MKNKIKSIYILAVLIFLAVFIRIYGLTDTPPLDLDEYGIYYNAYAISVYGIDEWGKSFPLFFQSFGDYKLALDIYLSALFFKLFEPSVFWLRFPSVIFSVLYIPFVYLLLNHLTKNKWWGVVGAIIMTFLPTSIFYSHTIGASVSATLPIFAAFTLFVIGFQKKHASIYILVSSLLFTLSLYAYPLSWIIVPLLVISFSFFLLKEKKIFLIGWYAIVAFASIPILFQFFVGGSAIRVSNTSAFSPDRGPYLETQQFRQTAENNLLSKLFHNKPVTSIYIFVGNYLKHFSVPYLAFDKSEPKIQISPYPALFLVMLPFYLYGIFVLFKKRSKPAYTLLLIFILIAPLPSAITEGAVHPKRYLASLGLETILIVLAISSLKIHKKKIIASILLILFFIEFALFWTFFNTTYKTETDQLFYAKARLIEKLSREYWPEHALYYSTEELGEPQIYPLVGALYSPVLYQETRVSELVDNWVFVRSIENLSYHESIETVIQKIQENRTYPAYGVFSSDEILKFPPSVCFDTLSKDLNTKLETTYLSVRFKPCVQ